MCIDTKIIYLCKLLYQLEYMRILFSSFPEHIIKQYNLRETELNGYFYVEIRRFIYGLPHAGKLINKGLKVNLAPHYYFEVPHTPGLWRHITRPITFSLVVDDFGVKYFNKLDADHLISAFLKNYEIPKDWKVGLYCGITLKWKYGNKIHQRYVDMSMPGYVTKQLKKN